jgi:hypothetical protein
MKLLTLKPVQYHYEYCYRPAIGSYGIPHPDKPKYLIFYTCREEVQSSFFPSYDNNAGHDALVYVLNSGTPHEQVVGFIKSFEQATKIKGGATFGRVENHKDWLHIRPNWWKTRQIRFSLLTVLLRAANEFETFETAIQLQPYLRQTAAAVSVFMEGNTWSSEKNWVDSMPNTIEAARHCLRKEAA